MPTGYSFNLDGSTLYLAMASVFVAQAAEATIGQHMSLGQQILMVLTLMITSKGVAAVPRASLVILLGAAKFVSSRQVSDRSVWRLSLASMN